MGEFFEVTFYSDKLPDVGPAKEKLLDTLKLSDGRNAGHLSPFRSLKGREIYFQVYEEENYDEYQICVEDLRFTREDLDVRTEEILEVVSACFDSVPALLFGTGIYELTFYYREKIEHLWEFPQEIFPKMPFLFFRKGADTFGYTVTKEYQDVSCVVQTHGGIQDIFPADLRTALTDPRA